MQISMKHTILTLASFFLLGCTGNSLTEEIANEEKGTIVLTLSSPDELYTETRAELADISGYIFTLNNANGNKTQLSFNKEPGKNSFIATAYSGTYTLTAENVSKEASETGKGKPYYTGTSAQFTVEGRTIIHTSIAMGRPKNAKISISIDDSFSSLYDLKKIVLSTPSRTLELLGNDNLEAFFFPENGTLAYTIQAEAKKNSHVQEIPTSGVTGTLTIEAGKYYPVTLQASPATGIIIPLGDDNWNDEFDAKQERY